MSDIQEKKAEEGRSKRAEHIAILVCTRDRPEMLAQCLASLNVLRPVEGASHEVIIVDNSADGNAKAAVDRAFEGSDTVYTFAHVADPGIPIARNKAIDLALGRRADFLAMIDDDEIATPQWLAAFMAAARQYPGDIYCGPVSYILPHDAPAGLMKKGKAVPETGKEMRAISTANLLIRASLFDATGLGLRFDERMRFTGGSDKELFRRAHKKGARAISVSDALVEETIPAERLSSKWQLRRHMRTAVNDSQIHLLHRGRTYAFIYAVLKLITLFPRAALRGLASILFTLFDRPKARRYRFNAARDLAVITGFFMPLFGRGLEPYSKVEGH